MTNDKTTHDILNLRMYKIFRKMGVPRNEMNLQSNLYYDLCFDNFDMNILLFYLESKFDIEVNESDVACLTTIGKTLHFIEQKLNVA